MFKFLRKLRRQPKHVCTDKCDASPSIVQAKLRVKTENEALAYFLDSHAHATLMRDMPIFDLIQRLGPHLQWDEKRLSLVKVHDDAHHMIDNDPRLSARAPQGNVRAGGREIAALLDSIIRRELITASVDTHINRTAYFDIMLAQANMLSALQKLTTLNRDVPVPDVVDSDKAV